MRLGGPIYAEDFHDPDSWVAAARQAGYRAAVSPVGTDADEATTAAYIAAARAADIVIAEVGAWSNPLSKDAATRDAALDKCKAALALAEKIGARCCVNITGSRGDVWDGPDAANLTDETFEMIVAQTREIIDSVQPTRTFYTLEPMPWAYPDSADSYLRLVKAIDRPGFGVHYDPVNMISSPQLYYGHAAMIRDFVAKLGPYIKSVHLKDIILRSKLTVHLDEARPGAGELDFGVLLTEVNRLGPDMTVMLEHLPAKSEYVLAAESVRSVAQRVGIAL